MDEKTALETIKNLRFHADKAQKEGRPERAKELRDEAEIYEKQFAKPKPKTP